MSNNFRRDQKVVSIIDWPAGERAPPNRPVKGGVYTIRDIRWWYDNCYLRLNEIHNAPWDDPIYGLTEPGFTVTGFRPVVEPKRETSIEVFRRLLVPTNEPVS